MSVVTQILLSKDKEELDDLIETVFKGALKELIKTTFIPNALMVRNQYAKIAGLDPDNNSIEIVLEDVRFNDIIKKIEDSFDEDLSDKELYSLYDDLYACLNKLLENLEGV